MADATLPVDAALTMVTCLTPKPLRMTGLIGNQHLTGGRKIRTVTQRSDPEEEPSGPAQYWECPNAV